MKKTKVEKFVPIGKWNRPRDKKSNIGCLGEKRMGTGGSGWAKTVKATQGRSSALGTRGDSHV